MVCCEMDLKGIQKFLGADFFSIDFHYASYARAILANKAVKKYDLPKLNNFGY